MPSAPDPMASVGYLIAAVAVTVGAIVGYAVWLRRRLQEAESECRAQRK